MFNDGASSVGPSDDGLTFNSMTQKSGRGRDRDEEGVQYNSTINGSLDEDAIQDQ